MTSIPQTGWQHREHHMLSIGGVFFPLGFRAEDARALEALLRMPMAEFREMTRKGGLANCTCLGGLLTAMIHMGGDVLENRGAAHEFVRRREAYLADRASWQRSGKDTPKATWRAKYMTKGQRFLIHAICSFEQIPPPANMNRGEAADWLEAHDGHHFYRNDKE